MIDIAIPQRKELPPARVGAGKPPAGLADQSGVKQVAQTVAGAGTSTFQRLIQTRATNEEAQFQGSVSTAMQEFDMFVASNPGASFEDLGSERDTMLGEIKKAGGQATTKIAQANNANWYARNFESLKAQTDTSIAAIQSKQQLATADQISKGLINNFDKEGLTAFTQEQIANGLWEETAANARLDNQLEVIDEAQRKVAIKNASGIGFDVWQSTVTPEDPDGDLNAAFDAIDALDIPDGEKQEIESELKTRVNNRRAEAKLEIEQATKRSVEEINGRLNKGEFDGIDAFINAQPMTETQKNQQLKTAHSYISSVNNSNTKADFVTSDDTNIAIDRIIRRVRSGDMSYDDAIDKYKKVSKDVKATEGKTNLDNISRAADQADNADDRRKSGDYDTRARQLRDSIERQTSLLLEPDEIDEVLVDLANKAELELADKFDGIDYEKEDLIAEVDRLTLKYSLSEAQMTRAATARRLRLAESFEDQSKAIAESIRQLTEDGKRDEAKRVLEEAVSLGFDFDEKGKPGKGEAKTKKKSGVNKIIDRLLRR